MTFPADMRLLLAHKQKTSARVRFLRFPHGLTAFHALPKLSSVHDEAPPSKVEPHPALYLRSAEKQLGREPGSLALEAEFSASVDTPDGPIRVRLATFTSIDPATEHICDARCRMAKSRTCACSCGGANHGVGLIQCQAS